MAKSDAGSTENGHHVRTQCEHDHAHPSVVGSEVGGSAGRLVLWAQRAACEEGDDRFTHWWFDHNLWPYLQVAAGP